MNLSPRVQSDAFPPEVRFRIEGYLKKQKTHAKLAISRWNTRWFVADLLHIYYFRDKKSKEPLQIIDIQDVVNVRFVDLGDSKDSRAFEVQTNERTYVLKGTAEEAELWMQAIQYRLWKLNEFSKQHKRRGLRDAAEKPPEIENPVLASMSKPNWKFNRAQRRRAEQKARRRSNLSTSGSLHPGVDITQNRPHSARLTTHHPPRTPPPPRTPQPSRPLSAGGRRSLAQQRCRPPQVSPSRSEPVGIEVQETNSNGSVTRRYFFGSNDSLNSDADSENGSLESWDGGERRTKSERSPSPEETHLLPRKQRSLPLSTSQFRSKHYSDLRVEVGGGGGGGGDGGRGGGDESDPNYSEAPAVVADKNWLNEDFDAEDSP